MRDVLTDLLTSDTVDLPYSISTQRLSQAVTSSHRIPATDALLCDTGAFDATGEAKIDLRDYAPSQIVCLAEARSLQTKYLRQRGITVLHRPFTIDDIATELSFLEGAAPDEPPHAPDATEAKDLVFGSSDRYIVISPVDIVSLESSGNYTTISRAHGKPTTVSKQLGQVQSQLPSSVFFRVHHSHLVNRNYIRTVRKDGQLSVELTTGARIPVSRRRRAEFLDWLGVR